ncbi:MAG: heat-shock protein Hsp20 [Herpetosiphonaceae bacterium]|nr:MAG: heat-shock protein Hsp20 [Herpetosiphonaceae bacterium]
MTLSRWSPFEEALSLRDAMNRLFEESFVRPTSLRSTDLLTPALDLYESNEAFHVEMAVPGIKPEDLDITLQDNVLTISGEIKQEQQTNERQYHRMERRYGRFSRSISLPRQVKADQVSATVENGILRIDIPKAEEARAAQDQHPERPGRAAHP